MPYDKRRIDDIARVICLSGKFECGEGTCAPICMDQLGNVRKKGCQHATQVHRDLATQIEKAICQ